MRKLLISTAFTALLAGAATTVLLGPANPNADQNRRVQFYLR